MGHEMYWFMREEAHGIPGGIRDYYKLVATSRADPGISAVVAINAVVKRRRVGPPGGKSVPTPDCFLRPNAVHCASEGQANAGFWPRCGGSPW